MTDTQTPEPTPAVERVVDVLIEHRDIVCVTGSPEVVARDILEHALNVEEIARAMHGYAESKRIENPDALGHTPRRTWEQAGDVNRQIFRERATHLRTYLLGADQ